MDIVQGKYDEAEEHVRAAVEIHRRVLGDSHPDFATDLSTLANILQAQGKLKDAEGPMREALEVYKRAFGSIHPFVATQLNNIALLLSNQVRARV